MSGRKGLKDVNNSPGAHILSQNGRRLASGNQQAPVNYCLTLLSLAGDGGSETPQSTSRTTGEHLYDHSGTGEVRTNSTHEMLKQASIVGLEDNLLE